MDIKDSYLHGTVGVVKSISVDADTLKYTLADKGGTVTNVVLPTATQSANGLLSKEDKLKLDNMIATQVANNLTLKINSGTTEGTNLYTYNGSAAKTLDIKNGVGIGFTNNAGSLQIYNAGVRSIATGTTNGTISVNTNGTTANVAVKGLGSAAYTSSDNYAVIKTLNNENLNNIVTPGFYNAGGGNTCSNKPENVDHFGMIVTHCASGTYYVQILFEESLSNLLYRRHCINGTWSNWTLDKLTDTTYSVVSSSANGLAPKVINTNTATVGSAYYVLASTNGSASPSWYKLPANAFKNDNTTYTFTSGTTGNFTVTPSGGTAQTVSIGKPATAGTADIAVKLQTKRKLWGLDFDGSADVSGNMTDVGTINNYYNFQSGDSVTAVLHALNVYANVDYIHIYVSNLDKSRKDRPLVLQNGYGNVGIGVIAPTQKLEVSGNVKATSFIGNLDGTYVNKLTGYTKATAIGSIATTDSLNTALGKLEFKTDFIYNDLFGTDNDDVINKWHEIVDFIDSVAEDTDITDEFVTRKTDLTITGLKTFESNSSTTGVSLILKNKGWTSHMSTAMDFYNGGLYKVPNARIETKMGKSGVTGGTLIFYTLLAHTETNPNPNGLTERFRIGDDGTSKITGAFTTTGNVTATKFIGNLNHTLTFSAGAFSAKTYNNSATVTVSIPTHTSHLTNNSGFLTQHQSLANYVTIDGTLTISGLKKFSNNILFSLIGGSSSTDTTVTYPVESKYIGWTGASDWARIFYRLTAYNKGHQVFQLGDDSDSGSTWIFEYPSQVAITVSGAGINPGTNNELTLGTSSLKWKNVYATTFVGDLSGNVTGNVTGSSGSCTGNAASATSLASSTIVSSKSLTLKNTEWTDTGYTFASLTTGTYAVQITSGSNLVASGIMSVYKNLADTVGDEIPLHVYGTAAWRPYLRTYNNKLLISSNDVPSANGTGTSRTITIKIARII